MKNLLFKKEVLLGIRIFSIICAIFLFIVEIHNQKNQPAFTTSFSIDLYAIHRLIGNSIVIILSILLALKPQKLEFLAFSSFYYSLMGLTFDFDNPMGICMFFLGITVLYVRGFFLTEKKKKCIALGLLYIVMIFSGIHFGFTVFLDSLIYKIAYTLVLSIIFFLLVACNYKIKSAIDKSTKILNLSIYPELVQNDVSLLQKVLENKQYKVIALETSKAEGTVRNRLNKIYDVLGVMDRMGFISTYMGYEIVFAEEEKKSLPQTKNL